MFGQKKTRLLGIDIGSSSVKVLDIAKKGDKYSVEGYAVEPLLHNCVVERKIVDEHGVAVAIKHAVIGSRTKIKQVAAVANSVITKKTSYPANLPEGEIEERIIIEAENLISYPIEDVSLDFEILGPSDLDANVVDVLLVASLSENIDAQVGAIEKAGLEVRLVGVEIHAVENAFSLISKQLNDNKQGLTVAIVDVGADMTTLHILVDGKVVFTREQAFGGNMLTEHIERHYGMSHQEAERAKKEHNLPDDYDLNILEPFKQAMVTAVARTLQFFSSTSTQHQSIDHVVLAGGCASISGIAPMIEKEVGTTTSVANPFTDMTMASRVKVKELINDSPSMLIACGLALNVS